MCLGGGKYLAACKGTILSEEIIFGATVFQNLSIMFADASDATALMHTGMESRRRRLRQTPSEG